jgi:hypothetical protein
MITGFDFRSLWFVTELATELWFHHETTVDHDVAAVECDGRNTIIPESHRQTFRVELLIDNRRSPASDLSDEGRPKSLPAAV